MKEILSYLKAIDIDFFNNITDEKVAFFIKELRERDFSTEEAFRKHICQGGKTRVYYNNLKTRVIKTLRFMLLIAPQGKGTLIRRKFEKCQILFFFWQRLHYRSVIGAEGLSMLKKAHKIAIEYDFTFFACEISSSLCSNAASYKSNLKLVNKYASQLEYYSKNFIAEKKAEVHYYRYLVAINTRKRISNKEINENLEEISKLDGRSIRFQFFYFTYKVIAKLYNKGYHEVISSCQEALSFLEGKKGTSGSYIQFFIINKGTAEIALGLYKDARLTLMSSLKAFKFNLINNYVAKFYLCINALHAQDYSTAFKYYRENRHCKFFFIRKEFTIVGAYLYFLAKNDYLPSRRFRIGAYLDGTAFDKESFDINILIAELLVFLAKDRALFTEKIRSIEPYQRHYAKDSSIRGKQFLKMLTLLVKFKFHPTRIEQGSAQYLKNIKSQPLSIGGDLALEFIPFERVWNMILNMLKKKI